MAAEIVDVNMNLDLDGDYEICILELREKLAHSSQREEYIDEHGAWLEDHPLLPKQLPEQPARWMHIHIAARDKNTSKDMQTTIAVRDDNVYLIGFKNGSGKWYEFGTEENSVRFIQGSTFLGCFGSYRELFRESGYDLNNLSVGKNAAIDAVRTLSGYEGVVPADAATRVHLACLCVMISESARMMPLYDIVTEGWNHMGSRTTTQHVWFMKNWSCMSRELLSVLNPTPERERLLDVVHLLLNPPDYIHGIQEHRQQEESATPGAGGSSQQGPDSPRPETLSGPPGSSGGTQKQGQMGDKSVGTKRLVQVYSVKADSSVIGHIVVFDGKRGQIIWKHNHQSASERDLYGEELALTGPCKAISADGSFAIQVHGITSGSDESSRVIGEMLCDCYANNGEYDTVLTGDIISTGNSQHTLGKVEYAVLSDAVEASVEVNFLLPGVTYLYGMISRVQRSSVFQAKMSNIVVLFKHGTQDEKLELAPSAAGLMVPLELGTSLIAVPFSGRYSCVCINVELIFGYPNEEGEDVLWGTVKLYFDKHTGQIRVETDGDITVPGGWRKGIPDDTEGDGTGQTTVQQGKVQLNITSPGFHVSPLQPESLRHMGLNF